MSEPASPLPDVTLKPTDEVVKFDYWAIPARGDGVLVAYKEAISGFKEQEQRFLLKVFTAGSLALTAGLWLLGSDSEKAPKVLQPGFPIFTFAAACFLLCCCIAILRLYPQYLAKPAVMAGRLPYNPQKETLRILSETEWKDLLQGWLASYQSRFEFAEAAFRTGLFFGIILALSGIAGLLNVQINGWIKP